MNSLAAKLALVILITALAAWLRLAHLGAVNFYNDEYYQFETAVGWLQLGDWVRYDFYTDSGDKPYDRARLFIYQVAASIQLFGSHEAAARLPAALWGVALIPLVVVALLRLLKHDTLAYLTGFALAVDDFSISLSRYVRMYSLLMVCAVALTVCLYQCLESKRWRPRLAYGLASLVITGLALAIFKELTLALLAALGVYATLRAVLYLWRRQAVDLPWTILWFGGMVGCVVALGLSLAGINVIPLDAVIVRAQPHWTYLLQLFDHWRLAGFAAGFALLGIGLALKQVRSFVGCSAVISLVVVIYFTFFSHRWDAQRYLSIVTPLITLLTVYGAYYTWRFLFALLPKPTWLRYSLILPLAFFTGPWVSLPDVTLGNDWLLRTAYANRSTTALGYADMKTAYAYVADHVQPGEVVLMQGPRFYYWPDDTIPVYKLGGYQSLTLPEFKALAKRGTSGGWVVFNATHQRHLRDNIKNYVHKHFAAVSAVRDTGVVVFHFLPEDVK